MIGLIVFLALVVIAGVAVVTAFNGLVRSRNVVKNSWAQIDVQLKRRHDLIPNLVEVVKDYMDYEQEVLENVTKARSQAVEMRDVSDPAQRAQVENALSQALRQLYVVVENYPQLRANENVMRLQEELTSTENKIAFARQFFNDSVMRLNNKIEMFPTNLVAGMFGFQQQKMFETPEGEREPVKVDLR